MTPTPPRQDADRELEAHGMDCCWDCFHGRRTHDPAEDCWCSEANDRGGGRVTDHPLPPGASWGEQVEREWEPLLAEDHSVWTFDAKSGGYVSPDNGHAGVICRTAAAVADHVNGPNRTVRQWHGKEQQQ